MTLFQWLIKNKHWLEIIVKSCSNRLNSGISNAITRYSTTRSFWLNKRPKAFWIISFMSEQTLDIYSMYKNFCNFLTSALRLQNLRYASESLSRPLLMYFFRDLNLSLINCISLWLYYEGYLWARIFTRGTLSLITA